MKHYAVSVRDSMADVFGVPNFFPSLGLAIRAFGDAVNNKESGALANHPEDFALYSVGVYDDQTSDYQPQVPPKQISTGKDHVRSTNGS